MKAIVQDRFGPADALDYRDVDDPAVGPGDVLVRVRAAGCGPDVWHLMTGKPYFMRLMPELRKLQSGVRGRDVAGQVVTVGADVAADAEGLRPGDEVLGIAEGSFAELAVARATKLVRKPARLTFEQAAALPISGLTALQAVRDAAAVRSGQRVLVIGAGGGVGTLTVQIAKSLGAEVTAACSASKTDLVRSIGADHVIDYTQNDFTRGTQRWDTIIDTAGRRPLRQLRRALTRRGTLVIVGGDGGGRWTGGFFRQLLRAPLFSLFVGQTMRPIVATETLPDLEELVAITEAGTLTPVVGATYRLPDTADAIRYLETGHAQGKVVIIV